MYPSPPTEKSASKKGKYITELLHVCTLSFLKAFGIRAGLLNSTSNTSTFSSKRCLNVMCFAGAIIVFHKSDFYWA